MNLRYMYNGDGSITAQIIRNDEAVAFGGLRVIAAYTLPASQEAEFKQFMDFALDMANRKGYVEACEEFDKDEDAREEAYYGA